MKSQSLLDCIIIGGGTAGLTAALYLARFRRNFIIFDAGDSRTARIPLSRNYPAFPDGISGDDVLKKLKAQLKPYSVSINQEKIETLELLSPFHFVISTSNGTFSAQHVILATGVKDRAPDLPHLKQAVALGLVRYCPVCDAFEIIDKKIAVITQDQHGLNEALFLRHYSPYITLIIQGKKVNFSHKKLQEIKKAKIQLLENPVLDIHIDKQCITAQTQDHKIITFDALYCALGCIKNNKLAMNLGAKETKGDLIVNKHQQTSIKGLYAIGDSIFGLNQLCVAQGSAAIAAVAIHNHCANQY